MYYSNYQENHYNGGIGKGILNSFKKGSSLTRLIYINCGLFLALNITYVFFLLAGHGSLFYQTLSEWLGVPADLEYLLYRPWTLVTYMFTQFGFIHLLFNMLWLYWFGSLFLNHFTQGQLTKVYLGGGLAGAALFIAAYNTLPYFDQLTRLSSWAIGASASVMAIVFAVCTYLPQYKVYIFLIGPVKLIYLAIFTAGIDLLSIQYGNAGGHIAHLGGALYGWLFILCIRKKIRVKCKKKVSDTNKRDSVNRVLDKISKSGYESLTREEKEILFKGGN